MVDRPEPEGAPEPSPRLRLVMELPVRGVVEVSLRRWRANGAPDDDEIGWTTETEGGW